jgi:ubiquinone/menaquinone biosynthesis C-methylase UbiE
MPEWATEYTEIRFDIDESQHPDIVGNMVDIGQIGPYDAIYCQHALEHLTFKDAAQALREFRRVLKDGGFAMVMVPDLEGVSATAEPILQAPIGPITGIDMIYGLQSSVNPYMAHKSGYVRDTLHKTMNDAGFSKAETRRLGNYNLISIGVK